MKGARSGFPGISIATCPDCNTEYMANFLEGADDLMEIPDDFKMPLSEMGDDNLFYNNLFNGNLLEKCKMDDGEVNFFKGNSKKYKLIDPDSLGRIVIYKNDMDKILIESIYLP